jgi:hypothetical protein
VSTTALAALPVPRINFTTPPEECTRLTAEVVAAYARGDGAGVLRRVQAHIDAGKTDVVHDFLAHLAQQMIALNQHKQGEVKRFLAWVEERLTIQPDKHGAGGIDSLTGKTLLRSYGGDYQKGAAALPWCAWRYRLHQNRHRFAVSLSAVESDIQHAYERSLQTLIPIKHGLSRTDALIDQIVYCLYGLTAAEVALIER